MSLYSINNSTELEKQADVTNLALWAGLFPVKGATSKGTDFVQFCDGKNTVFVTTRGMSKEELVNNLSNVCKAAKLDPQTYVLPLVEGKIDSHSAGEAIYNEISNNHRRVSPEKCSALLQAISQNVADYDKIAYNMGVDVGVRQDVKTQIENSIQSVSKYQADKKMRETLKGGGLEESGEPSRE